MKCRFSQQKKNPSKLVKIVEHYYRAIFHIRSNSMLFNVIFLLMLICGLCLAVASLDGPLVKLPQGRVQGTYQNSYKNRTFSAFEGIPYGEPPIGDLRFEAPMPADGWDDTLLANKHYECMHFMPFPLLFGPRGTEDCLYMYVYVPREKIDANELLNVVVHIHGGGFMLGAPKYMAGPQFMMDQDVVVVSFNYRLGILGFLSTEDNIVSGNNGLKDQSLALQWIKDNIKYFGGNPASITITGLSAGAASVHFHYFSPLSKGLFHRGFSQSGTALNCWALTETPLTHAQVVAKNISCPTSSTKDMVDCMRTIDDKKLIHGVRSLFVYMDAIPFTPFGPVVEKHSEYPFLDEHPYTLLKEGRVYDVPWISSNVKDEGLFPVGFFVWLKKLPELDRNWDKIMTYALELQHTVDDSLKKEVLSKIKEFYFKGKSLSNENMFSLVELFSDRMFLIDSEKSVRLHSQAVKSELYFYMYSYLLQMPHFPPGMPKGAPHGDDGRLIFKMFGTPKVLEKNDEQMMELFTDFIAKFAETGIPSFATHEWIPVSPGKPNIDYLHIGDVDSVSMKTIERLAPNDFWQTLPIVEVENAVASPSTILCGNGVLSVLITMILCLA